MLGDSGRRGELASRGQLSRAATALQLRSSLTVGEHWRRDKPQFFNVHGLEWEPGAAVLNGLETRTISRDPASGNTTCMARMPRGWRRKVPADSAAIELFVLEGDVSVEGDSVGAGGYVFVPPRSGGAELGSRTAAQALVFWNPGMPTGAYDERLQVRRVWQEPWQAADMPGAIHGAMFKSLRLPDAAFGAVHGGAEGAVRLFLFTPGFSDPREHVHSVWEEMIYLTGDMMMPDRGVLAPGSYMGNPAEFWHAPMICHQGAVLLFHNHDPIDMETRAYPDGEEIAERYRESESWLVPPAQRDWSEMPEYHTAPSRIPA